MDKKLRTVALLPFLFPTRTIALFMLIGFADLISTAMLHERGLIVEMNPLMRHFLSQGEWLFVLVKSATLVAAWIAMALYCRHNIKFVRTACIYGSGAYLALWMGWFAYGVFA